jgi:hypothetical protein
MVQQQDTSTGTVPKPERRELSEEERQQVMERFWEAVQSIGERNRHLDPDYVMAVVTEVVEEVRQEQYEREQREAERGR